MLRPGERIERYEVIGLLGSGGLADVYAARHVTLHTEHALKLLRIPSPSVRERLVQEGRIQASLDGPNLVRVTDVLEHNGAPVLVMDRVLGPALDRVLSEGALTLAQADHLVWGILAGVSQAHAKGLIHRDLKPANVLLALGDGAPVARVADFGLAKALDTDSGATATRSGMVMGTPAYMAPEQVRSTRDVDARADVFALGVLLYELFAGERPFSGQDLLAHAEATSSGTFVPLEDRCSALDPQRLDIIKRALSPSPDDRYPDATALLAAWQAAPVLGGASWPDWSELTPVVGTGSENTWAPQSVAPPSETTVDLVEQEPAALPAASGLSWREPVALLLLAVAIWAGWRGLAQPSAPPSPPLTPVDAADVQAARVALEWLAPGLDDDHSVEAAGRTLAHIRSHFESQLKATRASYLLIAEAVETAELPALVIGIPYLESQLRNDASTWMCAAGPWQFLPVTAVQAGLDVADCVLDGVPEPWTPAVTDLVGPEAAYVDAENRRCRIQSCRVDERLDLARSTEMAIAGLSESAGLRALQNQPRFEALIVWTHVIGQGQVLDLLNNTKGGDFVSALAADPHPGVSSSADYPARAAIWAAAAHCLAAPMADRDREVCAALGWPVTLTELVGGFDESHTIGVQPLEVLAGEPALAKLLETKLLGTLEAAGARVVTLEAGDPAEVGRAAEVDQVLHGEVGALGDTILLNLQRTEPERGVVGRGYREAEEDAAQAADALLLDVFLQDLSNEGSTAVTETVRRYMADIHNCYRIALVGDPTLEGRVEFSWVVSRAGKVSEVEINVDTVGNDEFLECSKAKMSGWLFPPGVEGQIRYPFLFTPG